jgi:hypothetical protein
MIRFYTVRNGRIEAEFVFSRAYARQAWNFARTYVRRRCKLRELVWRD